MGPVILHTTSDVPPPASPRTTDVLKKCLQTRHPYTSDCDWIYVYFTKTTTNIEFEFSPATKFKIQKTFDIILTTCFYLLLVVFYIERDNIYQDWFFRRLYSFLFAFRLITLRFSYTREALERGEDWAMWRNVVYLLWAAVSIKEMAFLLGYY